MRSGSKITAAVEVCGAFFPDLQTHFEDVSNVPQGDPIIHTPMVFVAFDSNGPWFHDHSDMSSPNLQAEEGAETTAAYDFVDQVWNQRDRPSALVDE
jgi:hypothetical protein